VDILTEIDAGVCRIEFNRPEKKNAITAAMYQTLADTIASAQTDTCVRVILIHGKSEIFTAGNDLEDFQKNPPHSENSSVFQFLYQISHAKKPIVAAVSGAAVGIGTTLLLHCDLVYAADSAKFSLPFTQLGLVPEAASSLLLPQLAGIRRASEKLLLGEPFLADEALAMGLVNKVMPVGELMSFAWAQVHKLVALPATSLTLTKGLMKEGQLAAVEARMANEGELFRARLSSPEAREAFMAFFQKRKPDFSQFS
jgi:enoyl-CoA hydratase/carnithine racemase